MDTPSTVAPQAATPGELPPRRMTGRLVAGLFIIAAGVLFLLDNFGLVDADRIWRYWPLIFIAVGTIKLVTAAHNSQRIAGLFVIGIGSILFADELGYIHFSVWNLLVPALLIFIGLRLVGRAVGRGARGVAGASRADDSGSHVSAFAVMSGIERKLSTPDFRGGDATAIMGGCTFDLRQCDIRNGPAVFDAFALWGGIEVYVPGNWTVRSEGIALLGGFGDSRKDTAGDPSKVLIIWDPLESTCRHASLSIL